MKRKIIFIVIVVVVIFFGTWIIKKKKMEIARMTPPRTPPPAVLTASVIQGTLEVTAHYLGIIVPFTRSDLSSRISGHILSIAKREGDQVRKGELLVTIDDRELVDRAAAIDAEIQATRAKLAGARSAFETQQAIHARDIVLYKAGAISQEALERSQALLDGYKATMDAYEETLKGLAMNAEAARIQLEYARIYAPFNGVISKRWAEPGDLAVPGKPILTIDTTSSYKVLVQVPQENLTAIHAGTKVYLTNGDQRIENKVNRIYPALGKNMQATIEILSSRPPFNLPADATVGVDIVTGQFNGMIVPEQALVKTNRGTFVYVVKNGKIHICPVKNPGVENGRAVVIGELNPGDLVAVAQENKLLTFTEGSVVTTVTGDAKPSASSDSAVAKPATSTDGRNP
jgi:RND family efflux transporter MFP subunit